MGRIVREWISKHSLADYLVILGPYRLFDPERFLKQGEPSVIKALKSYWDAGNFREVNKILDTYIELGKDKTKMFFMFICRYKEIPHRKKRIRFQDSGGYLLDVSRTGIIHYSREVRILPQNSLELTRRDFINKADISSKKCNLDRYFREIWAPKLLSGERKEVKHFPYHFLFLRMYMCLYISNKQGWL